MLRKFLLFLLRVTDKSKTSPQKVTDNDRTENYGQVTISNSGYVTSSGFALQAVNNIFHQQQAPKVPSQVAVTKEMTIENMKSLVGVWHQSQVISNVLSFDNIFKGGYKLNNLELQLMDEMVNKYTTQYRSPLAKAMQEPETNEN